MSHPAATETPDFPVPLVNESPTEHLRNALQLLRGAGRGDDVDMAFVNAAAARLRYATLRARVASHAIGRATTILNVDAASPSTLVAVIDETERALAILAPPIGGIADTQTGGVR